MRNANWIDIFLLLIGKRKKILVEGNSMLPGLKAGDIVIIKKCREYGPGDIVVSRHPYKKTKIIKRIGQISPSGKIFLAGDNPDESSDSRIFGEIAPEEIEGKATCRILN